jgi:hypothetical protein
MSKVPQHLIDEATKRGIIPGAVIKQFTGAYVGDLFVVAPSYKWEWCESWLSVGRANEMTLYAMAKDVWARVITPAPAPQEEEGLKEGDACECGPVMRAAIVDLAIELGLAEEQHRSSYMYDPDGLTWSEHPCPLQCGIHGKVIMPEEFIRRMRVTAKKPKPVSIAGHKVLATKGTVEIDDTVYANSTIRAIAEKLID